MHQLTAQYLRFDRPAETNSDLIGTAIDILQDSDGFIWIGTTDGLLRYDGKRVTTYRNIPHDTSSIAHNYITALYEDDKHRIWIGTRGGLCAFHLKSETISRYVDLTEDRFADYNLIHAVAQDEQGHIWYSTYDGVFRMDPSAPSERLRYAPDLESGTSIGDKVVWDIYEDDQGALLFGGVNTISVLKDLDDIAFQDVTHKILEDGLSTPLHINCLLYTSPSPRDRQKSRMPSSA